MSMSGGTSWYRTQEADGYAYERQTAMDMNRELMEGAIDLHLHASPDLHARILDETEIAREARDAGMRGFLSKCHYAVNSDRMYYVSKAVGGIEAFGGVVLNTPVGGLNPSAVEVAIKFGGKAVWMPSIFSDAHIQHFGGTYPSLPCPVRMPARGISVLDEEGNLLSVVTEILEMIAEADIILSTSHLSMKEQRKLIQKARRTGVGKILITHPHNEVPNLTLEEQVELVEMGAILEHCFVPVMPMFANTRIDNIIEVINRVGPENCVMATDFGQTFNPSPAEGLRMFIGSLLNKGISPDAIEIMVKKNPARLLGLD
jgi:hypothetical protein